MGKPLSPQKHVVVTPFTEVVRCRIVNEDKFGPEQHYAVAWADAAGNWHYGWVPAMFFIRGPHDVRVKVEALVEHPEGLLL